MSAAPTHPVSEPVGCEGCRKPPFGFQRSRASWLLVFVVVVPMLALATLSGNTGVIFPEGPALTLGVLALGLPGWSHSPVRLAAIPPLCAAIGVALVHAALARWVGELAAIGVAFACLQLLDSRLTPSLSAAAFPVVFDVRSWVFPLAVLVICATLATVDTINQRAGSTALRQPPGRLGLPLVLAALGAATFWIVLAGPVLGIGIAAVAPPLMVAMVERMASTDRSALTGLRHWSVIVIAGAAGAFAAAGIDPRWVGGVLAIAVVLVAFATVSGPHPPALAVCLIPQVAIGIAPGAYVAEIALGAGALYLAAGLVGHAPRLGGLARRREATPASAPDRDQNTKSLSQLPEDAELLPGDQGE